jgi:uncharacterized protein
MKPRAHHSEQEFFQTAEQADRQKLARRGLRVGKSRVGKGVYAVKFFGVGACIGEIEGTVMEDREYVSRYSFDLEDGRQLEPQAPFRYVNHSCEPNCGFRVMDMRTGEEDKTQKQLYVFARLEIFPGDELTFDYCWPADYAIPCLCRAPNCRGWIVNPEDLALLE